MKRTLVAFFLLLPFVTLASDSSDTTLMLEFQLRVRSEWRDGYRLTALPGETGNLLTHQRNRLGISGGWGRMNFRLQLQDVRNYGQPAGNTQGNIGAAEAWGSLRLREGLKVIIGRQKVDIDNGRIVGAANWANPGRFLDGLQFVRTRDQNRTALMVAWDEVNGTRRLLGHHIQRFGDRHTLTLLAFDQDSDVEFSAFTTGFTWRSSAGAAGWWATEGYLQAPDAGGTGWMWTTEAGRKGTGGHTWIAGLDLVSDAESGPSFTPLLGTNHKFYGWMDHFYLGAATNGLTDLHIRHTGPLSSSRSWGAVLHHFRTAEFGDLLAQEMDLFLTGQEEEGISWTIGWSLMTCTPEHVARQGHLSEGDWTASSERLQQWGWISINLQPSILLQ